LWNRRELEDHVARDMRLDRPAVDADGIIEGCAAQHVLAAELVAADDPTCFADAKRRRQVDDVGFLESGHRAQEFKSLHRLAAALDFAAREIVGFDAVDGPAVVARELREVHPPFDGRALRPHDRGLARKSVRAGGLGLLHQLRDRPPGVACFRRVHAGEAEHHRWIQHVAFTVADLERRAGPGREIAVAGAVDEDIRADRLPPGLGLDQHDIDARRVMHHDTGTERMEEDVDLVSAEQIVGRDLVGRGVVGLRENLAEDQMRRVQSAEPVDAREQFGRDALHDAMHPAMNIGMQPAEIGHARGRSHAAEKAVALDQERPPPGARSSDRGGNAGRTAAEHDDFIFAIERNLARGFFDGFHS
jgi:hypothetical protein